MANILLVDDDLVYLGSLSDALESFGHVVTTAATAEEARMHLNKDSFDVAICDTIMEGGGALTLLHEVTQNHKKMPFIVITGRPEIASSPLFREGMKEAAAKIEKSATVFEIDQIVRSLTR